MITQRKAIGAADGLNDKARLRIGFVLFEPQAEPRFARKALSGFGNAWLRCADSGFPACTSGLFCSDSERGSALLSRRSVGLETFACAASAAVFSACASGFFCSDHGRGQASLARRSTGSETLIFAAPTGFACVASPVGVAV